MLQPASRRGEVIYAKVKETARASDFQQAVVRAWRC